MPICGTIYNEQDPVRIERNKKAFLTAMEDPETSEYRIGGKLGFGGKIYRIGGQIYVDYDKEDHVEERDRIMEEANCLLRSLNGSSK